MIKWFLYSQHAVHSIFTVHSICYISFFYCCKSWVLNFFILSESLCGEFWQNVGLSLGVGSTYQPNSLWLSEACSGWWMIWYFSSMRKWHRWFLFLYEGALLMSFHMMVCSFLLRLRLHMCLDSSVLFLSLTFLNDCLWLTYHSLKVVSVGVNLVQFTLAFLTHCCLVYQAWVLALATQGICGVSPAVTLLWFLLCRFHLCFVMVIQFLLYVWHAGVWEL